MQHFIYYYIPLKPLHDTIFSPAENIFLTHFFFLIFSYQDHQLGFKFNYMLVDFSWYLPYSHSVYEGRIQHTPWKSMNLCCKTSSFYQWSPLSESMIYSKYSIQVKIPLICYHLSIISFCLMLNVLDLNNCLSLNGLIEVSKLFYVSLWWWVCPVLSILWYI